jgi:hypothetical protein
MRNQDYFAAGKVAQKAGELNPGIAVTLIRKNLRRAETRHNLRRADKITCRLGFVSPIAPDRLTAARIFQLASLIGVAPLARSNRICTTAA